MAYPSLRIGDHILTLLAKALNAKLDHIAGLQLRDEHLLLDLKVEFTQNRGKISKFSGRAEIAARYERLGGLAPGPLAWPVALARLRLAVAWGQLWRKWQRGEMRGDRYAGFETLALAILDQALDQFTKGRT